MLDELCKKQNTSGNVIARDVVFFKIMSQAEKQKNTTGLLYFYKRMERRIDGFCIGFLVRTGQLALAVEILQKPSPDQGSLREEFKQLLFAHFPGNAQQTFQSLASIEDQAYCDMIAAAAQKNNPNLDPAIITKAKKVRLLKKRFQLDNIKQAGLLLDNWRNVVEFFLFANRAFKGCLPFDVFIIIASYFLNTPHENDVLKIYNAVHDRFSLLLTEGIFNTRKAGLITQAEFFDKTQKEEARYLDRKFG